MKRKIIPIIIVVFWLTSVLFLLFYFKPFEKNELQQQEQVSENLANAYLEQVANLSQDQIDEVNRQHLDDLILSQLDYTDNKIYGKSSEKYAWGKIDCVVEIPAIKFRQCVFTGTQRQIEHDLGVWLPVTAIDGYRLGETRYCVYMHNPTNKSIQISKAQDNLKTNDYIIVTKNANVYLYRVESVTSGDRFEAAEKYVHNENIGPEKFYLFTCARGKWQGKSLIIDATLYDQFSIKEWQKNQVEILKEYHKEYNLTLK